MLSSALTTRIFCAQCRSVSVLIKSDEYLLEKCFTVAYPVCLVSDTKQYKFTRISTPGTPHEQRYQCFCAFVLVLFCFLLKKLVLVFVAREVSTNNSWRTNAQTKTKKQQEDILCFKRSFANTQPVPGRKNREIKKNQTKTNIRKEEDILLLFFLFFFHSFPCCVLCFVFFFFCKPPPLCPTLQKNSWDFFFFVLFFFVLPLICGQNKIFFFCFVVCGTPLQKLTDLWTRFCFRFFLSSRPFVSRTRFGGKKICGQQNKKEKKFRKSFSSCVFYCLLNPKQQIPFGCELRHFCFLLSSLSFLFSFFFELK